MLYHLSHCWLFRSAVMQSSPRVSPHMTYPDTVTFPCTSWTQGMRCCLCRTVAAAVVVYKSHKIAAAALLLPSDERMWLLEIKQQEGPEQ